jgi:hypothetical protein
MRRSMLIYGTTDMNKKLYEITRKRNTEIRRRLHNQNEEQLQQEKKEEERKPKKTFKEKLFIQPKPFLPFWDGAMLVIIAYSCFSSAYYAAIEFKFCKEFVFWTENVCTMFFITDILFNFVRVPEEKINQKVTHLELFKIYNQNGRFILDLMATIPFYFFQYLSIPDTYTEASILGADMTLETIKIENYPSPLVLDDINASFDGRCDLYLALNSNSNSSTLLKLIRLVRIQRIFSLLDPSRINKLVDTLFSGQTRSKKVVFQLIMKNVYRVFRLILQTVIITYFFGAIFYLLSTSLDPKNEGKNFRTYFELEDQTPAYKMITASYFSITTLSTVGYGDLYPISNYEKIFGMFIMLMGVAFFSFIMNSFIDIISTFNQNLGNEE